MAVIDCYAILDLPRDANLSQIRRAHRSLSHLNEGLAERLLELQHAVATLMQPAERALHDQRLAQDDVEAPSHELAPRMHLFDSFEAFEPSLDVIRTRWDENFAPRRHGKTTHAQPLNLEVTLAPEQARRGGVLPVVVPVADVCPTCTGTGSAGYFACDNCEGHGLTWRDARIDVILPANVPDGATMPVSMKRLGIDNIYLNLRFSISA